LLAGWVEESEGGQVNFEGGWTPQQKANALPLLQPYAGKPTELNDEEYHKPKPIDWSKVRTVHDKEFPHGYTANIYDPIEQKLDKHVFRNEEPRDSVINFIKRLYARALKEEFGIQEPEMFVDLYLTGSLTTYQYSETSDCDISVIPNYERFSQSFGQDANKVRKKLVSASIDHIDGTYLPGTSHPLQFFVVADGISHTDLYQPGLRSAWSIFDEMWIVPPERERSHEVASEFPDAYSRASQMADKMEDALDHDPEMAREL
jgi:hypothetical protein